MRTYTDVDVRRAQRLLDTWDYWLDAHPHEWGQVLERAGASDGLVGVNRLIEGLVPRNLAPCAACQLRKELPHREIRARLSVIDLIFDV